MTISSEFKISAYQEALLGWYQVEKRDLPWRRSGDPYHVWISEVMLQQTQVVTVIPYFERFMARFPTIVDLANADQAEVLKMWEGLGYYARARNFQKAAQVVRDQYGGEIPRSYDDFRSLPGVGPYIAAAVQSIAFEEPYAVVDGNVKRVLARLFQMDAAVNDTTAHKHFAPVANQLLAEAEAGDYNQALMELGALICRPSSPDCSNCPVADFCSALQHNTVGDFPKRKVRQKTPEYQVVAAVIRNNGKMLIVRRPEDGLLGGLWEFPNGRYGADEAPQVACVRTIRETTGLAIRIDNYLTRVRHAFTHFKIVVDVYQCSLEDGMITLNGPTDYAWITASQFDDYAFPKSNHKFLPLLESDSARS